MDSLENKELEMAETTQQTTEQQPENAVETQPTKQSILETFQTLLEGNVADIREQADQLKTQFYRIVNQQKEEARKQLEQAEEEAQIVVDEVEQQFRQLLNVYKEKRAAENARREAEMQQNQLRKENILEQLKAFSENETADVSANLQQVKELQQDWKSIGKVPPTVETSLNKQYTTYLERFYDLVHINNELREYDFKKNLEQKTLLCEQAEKLQEKEDVVEAFRALQTLHDDWKNIGPVAREVREEIWERFKAASTVINKRHQDFFEQLHGQEEENLQKKQAILEQLKAIAVETLTNNKLWDEATELVTKLQAEWRTIGFAPKKMNQQIYEEYRAVCDKFFQAKMEFYKDLKAGLAANLEKKRELLKQAEEWKESQAWKDATDKFVSLQKQWKEVGPVARKYSDEIWKQFSAACDYFFEQKKAANQGQFAAEKANLEQKRAIIAEIEALEVTAKEETLEKLHALVAKFNAIGFVPFKEKDKVMKQFRAACDRIYDTLHIEARNRRMDAFTKAVEGKDEKSLEGERRRLVRQYEALQADIKTAENNILFFSGNSKKGNKLVEDMERKIQQQKNQLADLEQRISLIDSKL